MSDKSSENFFQNLYEMVLLDKSVTEAAESAESVHLLSVEQVLDDMPDDSFEEAKYQRSAERAGDEALNTLGR